jgi:TonB-dependent Receptor Plug Domain/TonB dependent receptor
VLSTHPNRRSIQARIRGPFVLAFVGAATAALAAPRTVRAQSEPPPPAPSVPPAPSAPAPGDAPVEVTVHGSRKASGPPGADQVTSADARAIPGTFGDPFQALAALPGLAPMASGLPFFYVRGAPPADTGYFIDGVPVPTLFHIGPGASVVPEALVDHIDFFPGAAPARYGRYVGGIIAGQTTDPSPVGRGEASVRLFDASAFVETPLGESSNVVVAGRYGYPNLLLSIFAPTLSLHYGDYTFRWTHSLSDSDRISLFVLGAYDHEEDSSENLVPIDSQFHRFDLRYDHRWATGSLRVATTFGYDRTSGNVPESVDETVESTSARVRVELAQRLGSAAELSAGADANAVHYGYGLNQGALESAPSPVGSEEVGGAYADVTLHLGPGVDLVPGARVDAYRPSSGLQGPSAFAFDPKVVARVALSRSVTWVSTMGISHQEASYVVPIPGIRVVSDTGLQKVYAVAEGAELRLPWSLKARVTGFFDADRNVSDFVATCGASLSCTAVASVDGSTYGLEVLVERALTRRFGGWVSYTLSRAERVLDNTVYLSAFDRTHVLSAVAHYDLGHGYGAGLRATYYTGRPDIAPVPNARPSLSNEHRLPDYYRLDARLDKRWNLGGREWVTVVAEFFDATLTKEAVDYKCNFLSRLCTAEYVGPIALPSIGLEGGW